MEADFVTSGMFEEETVEIEDHNENSLGEGERCGICMDFVVDRGVLDCCQHWFCFGCIDNWASITNLCPLCQNEFQLITCVPVYDTLGNNKVDEDTLSSRDDDWSIEGKSSTLSFPSYYIDENAVTCLDGDGCKIRSGSMSIEENPNLDTSIACDSCDTWYHAFCVGFDVDGTCEDTWLCPRCTDDELPHKSDATSAPMSNNQCIETFDTSSLTDAGFPRKLSVDPGETAIVITMGGGNKWTELLGEEYSPIRGVGMVYSPIREVGVEFNVNGVQSEAHLRKEKITNDNDGIKTVLGAPELELFLSSDISTPVHLKASQADGAATSDDGQTSETEFINESTVDCHLSFAVENSSVDFSNSGTVDQVSSTLGKQSVPKETSLRDEEVEPNAGVEAAKSIGVKRKQIDCSDDVSQTINSGDPNDENAGATPLKKFRAKGKSQKTHHTGKLPKASPSDDLKKGSTEVAVTKDEKSVKCKRQGPADTPDIMSIVRGMGCASKERENAAAGLRMKKIMRTTTMEDKDSSAIVQKLREEIKEAVRNGSAVNMGENNLDPKLLAAFRAVITGPTNEPVVKKLAPSALKVKKSLLQKGKVRESLTKKIYGDSNGRRKRDWNRDCEVEFWKYRCMRATKPEKIATLKSVLDLLRKTHEGEVVKEGSKGKAESPILSRLYLADTSVFPRKNDIKPLSALGGDTSDSEKGRAENRSSVPNGQKASPSNRVPLKHVTSLQGLKDNNVEHSRNSLVASSDGSGITKKETCVKVNDKKLDKRKWALEVLARKKAASTSSRKDDEEDDKVILKGNYPLLGQLPKDMRPALAPSQRSMIPDSIRQTQLYRLTEFFLKKLNLPKMCRTAETELAVADAINIEKEVAEKSSTKMVYVNLCSQQMLHRSSANNSKAARASESDASPVHVDRRDSSNELPADPAITEALRKAGLLSDSPPASPHHSSDSSNEEGPDNILEIGTVPEVDIYGDFEYDLDDEDYIGATTSMTAVPTKTVQAEAEAKMKVVFSTLKLEEPNSYQDAPTAVFGNHDDSHVPSPVGLPGGEGDEEPSLAECEELYGPEKELMISRFQLNAPIDNSQSQVDNTTSASNAQQTPDVKNPSNHSQSTDEASGKDIQPVPDPKRQTEIVSSVSKKVEAYIKEHIRPLCKSGVISVEQYKWAVAKTTDKVMKYHSNSKNASFLIKEGEKVKKLAEQYIEAAQAQHKDSS